MDYRPAFVTETDEASWIDCTWASGLMFANMGSLGDYPSTRAEREALRVRSGDTSGGSNLDDLKTGMQRRYGWSSPRLGGTYANFWRGLVDGGAVFQGLYGRLPSHFYRWDVNFARRGSASTHAVFISQADLARRRAWWMDPLALPSTSYKGEWISFDAAQRYCLGTNFIALTHQGAHAAYKATYTPKRVATTTDALRVRVSPNRAAAVTRTVAKGTAFRVALTTTIGGDYQKGTVTHRTWYGIEMGAGSGVYNWIAAAHTKIA